MVQIILRVDQQIDMSVVIVNIYSLKESSDIEVCEFDTNEWYLEVSNPLSDQTQLRHEATITYPSN